MFFNAKLLFFIAFPCYSVALVLLLFQSLSEAFTHHPLPTLLSPYPSRLHIPAIAPFLFVVLLPGKSQGERYPPLRFLI